MRKFIRILIIFAFSAGTGYLHPLPRAAQAGALNDYSLRYRLDRSALPALTYTALTLKIYVGDARSVTALADGMAIPVKLDRAAQTATLTTTGTDLIVTARQASPSTKMGLFTRAALKDDRQWAWSQSFDDNTNFKLHGIPAFEQLGWRATVYLIGDEIDPTRNESWIVDRPDILRLAKEGWGIGNHSWSHATVAQLGGSAQAAADVNKMSAYLRQALNDAGLPNERLMSFAAPMFDSDYFPVFLQLRSGGQSQLLMDESGSGGILQVDAGAPGGAFPHFDPNAPLPRDWRVQQLGAGDAYEQGFWADFDQMIAGLDGSHHYWLNTFSHDVDSQYPDKGIFLLINTIYQKYGPPGNDSVWVAPSEEIFSYMLVRDGTKISFSLPAKSLPEHLYLPEIEK